MWDEWRGESTLIWLVMMAVLFLPSCSLTYAGQLGNPPADCKGECARQYRFLDRFNEQTEFAAIEQNFATAASVSRGKKYTIRMYVGDSVELFLLGSNNDVFQGIAIKGRKPLLHHARIPFLSMGIVEGRTVRYYGRLSDFSLSTLRGECEDGHIEPDPRWGSFFTPPCYFGRPGGYMRYHFQFLLNPQCKGEISGFQFSQFVCKGEKGIYPELVFISEAENSMVLANIVWQHIYFKEPPP